MDRPPKFKPPSHAIRVGTDGARLEYRRARAAAIAPQLERRTTAVSALGPPALTIPQAAGYAIAPPGTFDTDDMVTAARAAVDHSDVEGIKAKANKPFLVKLTDMGAATIASPLLQFALRRDVLATAAVYLGMVPILQYASVLLSSHLAGDPVKSQLYHCDSDEVTQVKVFVVCEEATAANGPLTFIPASLSEAVRDRLEYEYNTRLSDEEVYATVGQGREVALLGAPGTTAFLDTSRCLHYGSRFADPSARRLVVMLQYITPLAFILPDDHREGARFRHLAEPGMDEISELVLGAA